MLKAKKAPIAGPKNVDPKPLPKRRKPRLQVDPRKPRRPKRPVSGRQKNRSMMDRFVGPRPKTTSPTKRRAIPIRRKGSPLTGLGRMLRGRKRR